MESVREKGGKKMMENEVDTFSRGRKERSF